MQDNFIKGYAVIKSGWLYENNDNILFAYIPYIATIIIEENLSTIKPSEMKKLLHEKYNIEFKVPFINMVLNEAIERNMMGKHSTGEYIPYKDKFKEYCIDDSYFNARWNRIIKMFFDYIKKDKIKFSYDFVEKNMIQFIEDQNQHVVTHSISNPSEEMTQFEYYWYNFLIDLECNYEEDYNFIVHLCAGSLAKNALFYSYTSSKDSAFEGLNVYLDTPMILELLGTGVKSRQESYRILVDDMIKAKCNVLVFKHIMDEVGGILEGASTWANSPYFDVSEANEAALYFRREGMSNAEITEFISGVTDTLVDMGITINDTKYDSDSHQFQEDEKTLFTMIEEIYKKNNVKYDPVGQQYSIRKDVRSVVMVYRRRAGNISNRICSAQHIMITTNCTLASVSRNYEIDRTGRGGNIPACITADLLGTVMWLQTPKNLEEYQKKRLLADCYSSLKPTTQMISKYVKTLEELHKKGTIDEQKFILLRTHPLVKQTLFETTKGNYSKFNDSTIFEIYDRIKRTIGSEYEKQIEDMTEAYLKAQKEKDSEIKNLESKLNSMSNNYDDVRSNMHTMRRELELVRQNEREKNISKWTRRLCVGPIGIVLVLIYYIEVMKNGIDQIDKTNWWRFAIYVLLLIVLGFILFKLKDWIRTRVIKFMCKRDKARVKQNS